MKKGYIVEHDKHGVGEIMETFEIKGVDMAFVMFGEESGYGIPLSDLTIYEVPDQRITEQDFMDAYEAITDRWMELIHEEDVAPESLEGAIDMSIRCGSLVAMLREELFKNE